MLWVCVSAYKLSQNTCGLEQHRCVTSHKSVGWLGSSAALMRVHSLLCLHGLASLFTWSFMSASPLRSQASGKAKPNAHACIKPPLELHLLKFYRPKGGTWPSPESKWERITQGNTSWWDRLFNNLPQPLLRLTKLGDTVCLGECCEGIFSKKKKNLPLDTCTWCL